MTFLNTSSLRAWRLSKPSQWHVLEAVKRAFKSVPEQWHGAMKALGVVEVVDGLPDWAANYDAIKKIDQFNQDHGDARRWNLSDDEICSLASRLAGECGELDASLVGMGEGIEARIDCALMVVSMAGVEVPKALEGIGAIKRAQCERWWRRVLRVHVARVVEGGAVKLGIVNKRSGGYASNAAVARRGAQLKRNDEALRRSVYRNEAGQVWNLAELAALSVANPKIRGDELMTRIRGAEEYATERGHHGIFCTITTPSCMHPMTIGSGGRPLKNKKYDGVTTPRDAQLWLRGVWARVRADCARRGLKMYGVRVAEPHHDGTPHWHMLVWVESERAALELPAIIWLHALSQFGHESGAEVNRCNFKAMIQGGAVGYVMKYISKSIGHGALSDLMAHLDSVQGDMFEVERGAVPGHRRVDAWASTWGIRQFQSFGMPGVGLWRLLRRVTKDQAENARVHGDWATWRAWFASHKHGEEIKACWRSFAVALGGMALPRKKYPLRVAMRGGERVNAYGEKIEDKTVVGLIVKGGRALVTRRMAWVNASGDKVDSERGRMPAPWTSFNNCTARLSSDLWALVFGVKAVAQGGRFPAISGA